MASHESPCLIEASIWKRKPSYPFRTIFVQIDRKDRIEIKCSGLNFAHDQNWKEIKLQRVWSFSFSIFTVEPSNELKIVRDRIIEINLSHVSRLMRLQFQRIGFDARFVSTGDLAHWSGTVARVTVHPYYSFLHLEMNDNFKDIFETVNHFHSKSFSNHWLYRFYIKRRSNDQNFDFTFNNNWTRAIEEINR